MNIECRSVAHGSLLYHQTISLRLEMLREPLGLRFTTQQLEAEKDAYHLAAYGGDSLLACVVLEPLSAAQMRMRQLAVNTSSQKQGIGRQLVRFAEVLAVQSGYSDMIVHARVTARQFYQHCGYVPDGMEFTEVMLPHVMMRKLLQ